MGLGYQVGNKKIRRKLPVLTKSQMLQSSTLLFLAEVNSIAKT